MVLVGYKIDMENEPITAKLKTHKQQVKFFKNKLKELIFSF
jgi:hypothetical protein